jgi:hypothetical protein
MVQQSMAEPPTRLHGKFSSLSSMNSMSSLSSLSMLEYHGDQIVRDSLDIIEYGERRVRRAVRRAKALACVPGLPDDMADVSTASEASLIEVEVTPIQANAWSSGLLDIDSYDSCTANFEEQAAKAFDRAGMAELSNVLFRLRTCADAPPALWIKGVNFGFVPATSAERCNLPSHIPEGVLAGLANKLGTKLVGFAEEQIYSHPLFHDIRPLKGGKEGSVGDGKQPLDHHMDMSYMREKAPNYVALACLREGRDSTVTTPFVSNTQLYKCLLESYPEDIPVLSDPTSFDIRKPASTGGGLADQGALLTHTDSGPIFWLRVDHSLMEPNTLEAAKALEHVREILREIEITDVHLNTGDVLLINNYKSLHRRSRFTPTFTCTDRLLMRAYFKDGSVPSSRLIE